MKRRCKTCQHFTSFGDHFSDGVCSILYLDHIEPEDGYIVDKNYCCSLYKELEDEGV